MSAASTHGTPRRTRISSGPRSAGSTARRAATLPAKRPWPAAAASTAASSLARTSPDRYRPAGTRAAGGGVLEDQPLQLGSGRVGVDAEQIGDPGQRRPRRSGPGRRPGPSAGLSAPRTTGRGPTTRRAKIGALRAVWVSGSKTSKARTRVQVGVGPKPAQRRVGAAVAVLAGGRIGPPGADHAEPVERPEPGHVGVVGPVQAVLGEPEGAVVAAGRLGGQGGRGGVAELHQRPQLRPGRFRGGRERLRADRPAIRANPPAAVAMMLPSLCQRSDAVGRAGRRRFGRARWAGAHPIPAATAASATWPNAVSSWAASGRGRAVTVSSVSR